eukprot:2236700-Lingulodinium_polyedra.AAC.1
MAIKILQTEGMTPMRRWAPGAFLGIACMMFSSNWMGMASWATALLKMLARASRATGGRERNQRNSTLSEPML